MEQDTTSSRPGTASQSPFANVLSLSGYGGIAVGLCVEFYRLYLLDSVLGVGSAPPWLESSRFALLAGSLVVLMYTNIIDDVFEKWLDLVVLCILVGQWGVPLGYYLDATIGGAGSPYDFMVIICAGIYALVALVMAINYARRCWPTTNLIVTWWSNRR